MSDTQRTDDMVFDANCNTQDAPLWVVPAYYARQLQRELEQARESRAEWRRLAESKIRQLAQAQAELAEIKLALVFSQGVHAERDRLRAELEWIRCNCKVIHWLGTYNAYPIEHTLAANKDMWAELIRCAALEPPRTGNNKPKGKTE